MIERARSHRAAFKFGRLLMVGVLIAIGLATSAKAGTIYTYTGNSFTTFDSYACPSECQVTGSFTLGEALPANSNLPIVPISYSFTDGNTTWTQNNSIQFSSQVITNGLGAITGWDLIYEINPECGIGCTMSEIFTSDSGGTIQDMTQLYPNGSFAAGAYNFETPGIWTETVVASPEGPTLLLLGTGLLGLATMVLRRKQIA